MTDSFFESTKKDILIDKRKKKTSFIEKAFATRKQGVKNKERYWHIVWNISSILFTNIETKTSIYELRNPSDNIFEFNKRWNYGCPQNFPGGRRLGGAKTYKLPKIIIKGTIFPKISIKTDLFGSILNKSSARSQHRTQKLTFPIHKVTLTIMTL